MTRLSPTPTLGALLCSTRASPLRLFLLQIQSNLTKSQSMTSSMVLQKNKTKKNNPNSRLFFCIRLSTYLMSHTLKNWLRLSLLQLWLIRVQSGRICLLTTMMAPFGRYWSHSMLLTRSSHGLKLWTYVMSHACTYARTASACTRTCIHTCTQMQASTQASMHTCLRTPCMQCWTHAHIIYSHTHRHAHVMLQAHYLVFNKNH